MDAYNQGAQDELSQAGDAFPVWVYRNPDDGRSRKRHADNNGRYFPSSEAFTKVRGVEVGDAINCLLPDTPVRGRVVAASKAWYAGDVFQVKMVSGVLFCATANHPVLAEHGLVFANQLHEGQYLWSYLVDPELMANVQEQYAPVLIKDVFDSVAFRRTFKRASRIDFYGDGEFIKGDIHIVRSDRHEGATLKGQYLEQVGDISFKHALPHSVRMGHPRHTLRRRHLGPLESLGFARPSRFYSQFGETMANSAPANAEVGRDGVFRDSLIDVHAANLFQRNDLLGAPWEVALRSPSMGGFGVNAEHVRHFANGFATYKQVTHPRWGRNLGFRHDASPHEIAGAACRRYGGSAFLDRVLSIRKRRYEGFVYDVETDTGYFMAGRGECSMTIHKNCRCTFVPVSRRRWSRLREQGTRIAPGYTDPLDA